jgi:hypothetical protein
MYMYWSWVEDKSELIELAREHGILIGSFTNPSVAKAMKKAENPDYSMTDEEFDKQMDELDKEVELEKKVEKKRRRRHKVIKESK